MQQFAPISLTKALFAEALLPLLYELDDVETLVSEAVDQDTCLLVAADDRPLTLFLFWGRAQAIAL
jgi:hypothetical protein